MRESQCARELVCERASVQESQCAREPVHGRLFRLSRDPRAANMGRTRLRECRDRTQDCCISYAALQGQVSLPWLGGMATIHQGVETNEQENLDFGRQCQAFGVLVPEISDGVQS